MIVPVIQADESVIKTVRKPRLGFLGVGWIGRNRMEAIARSRLGEIVAVADTVESNAAEARKLAPKARVGASLDDLLELELDGIVIATPSALHPEQAFRALDNGIAVFCQKPLARTREETQLVIDAARQADRLLAVDLSYRFTTGMQRIREIVQSGELGQVFAVNLVFHNAYGPDKPWFYDPKLAGGGCLIDLGIHLVDLAYWILGVGESPFDSGLQSGKRGGSSKPAAARNKALLPPVGVTGRLFAGGAAIKDISTSVEDYATARIDLASGTVIQVDCSWRLNAGCDAVIRAAFYGTEGGVEFRNLHGSFYQFEAHRFRGTSRETLTTSPEDWGGRAAVDWLRRLSEGQTYDPEVESLVHVAETLDRIYGRA